MNTPEESNTTYLTVTIDEDEMLQWARAEIIEEQSTSESFQLPAYISNPARATTEDDNLLQGFKESTTRVDRFKIFKRRGDIGRF